MLKKIFKPKPVPIEIPISGIVRSAPALYYDSISIDAVAYGDSDGNLYDIASSEPEQMTPCPYCRVRSYEADLCPHCGGTKS